MAGNTKTTLGNYILLGVLGDGTEGRVYKASCAASDVPNVAVGELVAVKRLFKNPAHDNEPQQFKRQIEILSKLNHPNIVRYKDSFVWREKDLDEDLRCLVMELLDGEPLKALLEKNPQGLAWELAQNILAQTLLALQYASQFGVTHRDLKPSNIHITTRGIPKLLDFGIARLYDGEATTTSTAAGAKGTFDYMAPDFAKDGKFRGDEQSDIFSFGIILYYTLTGTLPFPPLGEDANRGYFIRWLGLQPLPSAQFQHPVFRVLTNARSCINRCIDPDRQARFKTFAEVMTGFNQIGFRKLKHGSEVYELRQWLGKGGFGEVFRGCRSGDQRAVAIKRLFGTGHSARFVREAKILREARHPHLTEYVDFVQVKAREDELEYYLILEFLEGMPDAGLRERIKKTSAGLDPQEVLQMFSGYLDCLEHLHRNGIIHRDIKPGNLYAPEKNPQKAKIFDLGIAHDEDGTRTRGQVPGTLDFMPPEFASQTSGRGSAQSDIYSIGVTLYQALTRKLPFPRLPKSESEAWVEFFRRSQNPPECQFDHPIFTSHPQLIPLIQQALANDPKNRFQSAGAMCDEVNGILLNWSLNASSQISPAGRDKEPGTEATLFVKSTAATGVQAVEGGTKATQLQNLEAELAQVEAELAAAPPPPAIPPPVAPAELERQRLAAEELEKKNHEAAVDLAKNAERKAAEIAGKRKQEEARWLEQEKARAEQAAEREAKLEAECAAAEAAELERARLAEAEAAEKKRAAHEHRALVLANFKAQAQQRLAQWTGKLKGFWDRVRLSTQKVFGRVRQAWQAAGGLAGLLAKVRRGAGRVAAWFAPIVATIKIKSVGLFGKTRQVAGKIATQLSQKWGSMSRNARIVVTASVALLVVLGFYFSVSTAKNHLKQKAFLAASAQANADFKSEQYPAAISQAEKALAIHPGDIAIQNLITESQRQIKLQNSYEGVMKSGRRALANQDYTNAVQLAVAALEQVPGDPSATSLKKAAQESLDAYHAAANAANDSFKNADYATAEASADKALALDKSDTAMQQLKADAHTRFVTLEAYQAALAKAQAAMNGFDYTNAVLAATEALRKVPGDANATRLRDSAQKNLDDYHQAVNDANAAFKNADYIAAEDNANIALTFYKNDAPMQQLRVDAHIQFVNQEAYLATMKKARVAMDGGDFTNAVALAGTALQKMPGERAATRLRDDAQKHLDDYHAAVNAAIAAYRNADYVATSVNADKALAIYRNDSPMQQLKAQAQAQLTNLQAFQLEITNAQAALDAHDFARAGTLAASALKKIPKDPVATKIRDTAQQSLKAFTDIANQAQSAYELDNYAAAVTLADKALALQTDNSAMQQLKTKILRRLDGSLVTLLESFNVAVALDIKYAEVKQASPLGPIGDAGKPYYQAQADKLEKIYRAGNWLGEGSRQSSLQDLRKAIEKWE